jgi:hypothetical protein
MHCNTWPGGVWSAWHAVRDLQSRLLPPQVFGVRSRLAGEDGADAGDGEVQHASTSGEDKCETPAGDAVMKDASPVPVEAAVKQEEDSGSKLETFPCLARGCGGTVALSADLCRFGHGVRLQCEGGKECHRFKWCNRSYALVPPQEWPTHLSWCGGNRTDHTPPIDSKLLRGCEEGSGEPAAPAEAGADGDSAAKTEAEGAAAADGPVSIFKEESMEVSATETEENEAKEAAKAAAAAAAAGAPSAPHPAPPAAPALVPARSGRPPRGGDGALRGAQASSSTPTVRWARTCARCSRRTARRSSAATPAPTASGPARSASAAPARSCRISRAPSSPRGARPRPPAPRPALCAPRPPAPQLTRGGARGRQRQPDFGADRGAVLERAARRPRRAG